MHLMAPAVKSPGPSPSEPSDHGPRRYHAPQRAQAAAQTKARIREAASALFVEHGYVATTIRDIASAAGVGERTVYAAFPSKADLFRHVLDVATVGDEQPVAVAGRPEIQQAFSQADPRTAISQTIDYTVALFERAGDLIMVTVQAADADPDMRAAADAGSHATRQLWRTLTQALHDTGALRPGLTAQTAADILYALASPHTHQLLRRHCHWTTQRYHTWLARAVTRELLAGTQGLDPPGSQRRHKTKQAGPPCAGAADAQRGDRRAGAAVQARDMRLDEQQAAR
jgi:AcrR family transcriptional regulator